MNKTLNDFLVAFNCNLVGEDISEQEAHSHLSALSNAITGIELPGDTFSTPMAKRKAPTGFIQIQTAGELKITFEDDDKNILQRALMFLRSDSVSQINVSVHIGASSLLEQYIYGLVKLVKTERQVLDRYQGSSLHTILVLEPNYTFHGLLAPHS